jgi:hypothetical protein
MNYVAGSHEQRFGTEAEITVEEWLKSLGWAVIRLCTIRNYEGVGAPLLMGARFNLILPDFQALDFTGRHRPPFFVEVKHKTQATECYKLAHTLVHGFGRRSIEQYREVERTTDIPVWLLVLEALTGELLALRVSRAEWDDEFGDNSKKGVDRGGMVYFRKGRFAQVAQMARIQQRLEV